MSQVKEEAALPSFHLFVLFRSLMDWMMPTALVTVIFARSTDSSANLPETPSQTHPEKIIYQQSGHPLGQYS